jgi:arylsulfatase
MTQDLDNLDAYGSPIHTPNLDSLVTGGIAYSNMHTTALCSPSRSCIITGRNHHSNNMACITEWSTGFSGYNGNIPFENDFFVGDASTTRLQHLCNRQMAPNAC